jgi:hypothetical protein
MTWLTLVIGSVEGGAALALLFGFECAAALFATAAWNLVCEIARYCHPVSNAVMANACGFLQAQFGAFVGAPRSRARWRTAPNC